MHSASASLQGCRSSGRPLFNRAGSPLFNDRARRVWPLEDNCAASPGDPSLEPRSPDAHARCSVPRVPPIPG